MHFYKVGEKVGGWGGVAYKPVGKRIEGREGASHRHLKKKEKHV